MLARKFRFVKPLFRSLSTVVETKSSTQLFNPTPEHASLREMLVVHSDLFPFIVCELTILLLERIC
jgi:hypothetical protein